MLGVRNVSVLFGLAILAAISGVSEAGEIDGQDAEEPVFETTEQEEMPPEAVLAVDSPVEGEALPTVWTNKDWYMTGGVSYATSLVGAFLTFEVVAATYHVPSDAAVNFSGINEGFAAGSLSTGVWAPVGAVAVGKYRGHDGMILPTFAVGALGGMVTYWAIVERDADLGLALLSAALPAAGSTLVYGLTAQWREKRRSGEDGSAQVSKKSTVRPISFEPHFSFIPMGAGQGLYALNLKGQF